MSVAALGVFERRRRIIAVVAAVIPVIATYFLFDYHLSSTGREVVSSWLQSEAVAIQEGNLLSSITKNQRVLLSSQFVQGITLFDTGTEKHTPLIQIGRTTALEPSFVEIPSGTPEVTTAGFLHNHVIYKIPGRSDLVLVFDVESQFLQLFFFVTVGFFILFVVALLVSVRGVEKREAAKREYILKQALNDFISREEPSELVERELPFIIQWWADKKSESDRLKLQEIENQSAIYLGELGARVAHDIRSPLNTINAVAENIKEQIPASSDRLLSGAIERIRAIANGIADQNRAVMLEPRKWKENSALSNEASEILIFPVLEDIVSEKQIQLGNSKTRVFLEILPAARFSCVRLNLLEFRRMISNLLYNALEAVSDGGKIALSLGASNGRVLITVRDNGRGIPKEISSRIGTKGFTYGKENGSGLGLYYAREYVHNLKGRLDIDSVEGQGTCVKIMLPESPCPLWLKAEIRVLPGTTIIAVDDDPSNHELLQQKFSELLKRSDLSIEHFFDPESFKEWYAHNRMNVESFLVLSDYQMQHGSPTGLELIEGLDLAQNAILVTNSFHDPQVLAGSQSLNVRILPKPLIPYIPIIGG